MSIALKNPRIHPTFASILSTIICSLNDKNKNKTIDLVVKKFENKSNSECLFLWLQRIAIVANITIECEEKLFKLVYKKHKDDDCEYHIWNSKDWLHKNLNEIINDNSIVDTEEIAKLSCVIDNKEVNDFHYGLL